MYTCLIFYANYRTVPHKYWCTNMPKAITRVDRPPAQVFFLFVLFAIVINNLDILIPPAPVHVA